MQVVYAITLGLVTLAGLLTLVRVVRGPTELDRVLALDVLVVLIVTAVTVEVARLQEGFNLALLGSVALLGFLGAAAAARLVELRGPPGPRPPRSGQDP
ncbi:MULTISPECIES: monovalent cation/H+ antiporter complex subunit F [Pseudofrankia]|uniref:monovalent cation/H+ antiporter complex subunit F n=1 Tax=Pseudofrankia TaxID=2994363 RepID=UPI000234C811|nr:MULTISPECIES: monovalent cation/H+ antiporter complex subunit F [Pseudofrankia]OHV35259.1 sodium:proton antiporter [Pseudofrankia sp. EUN1h]